MLASGAHVKIGAYEYVLDEASGTPYVHEYQPLFPSGGGEIVGSDGKRVTRPDLIFWAADDWTGGQGFETFDPRDPVTYHYGTANTRNPGEITSPPTRTAATGLGTVASGKPVILGTGDGKAWMGQSRSAQYSSNGTSWTDHADNPVLPAGYEATAIVGDGTYLYIAGSDSPWSSSGNRKIVRMTSATSSATDYVSANTGFGYHGLAILDGALYAWTGTELIKYDLNPSSTPLTHAATDVKYTPTANTVNASAVIKMVQGGKSVFFMNTSKGTTKVWEWRKETPTPIWELPQGFGGVDMCVSNDTLFVLGEYGTDKAALYGMNLQARTPLYLAEIVNPDNATHDPVAITGSFGNQVMMLFHTGTNAHTVYVYDSEYDGVSYLSSSSGTYSCQTGDVLTWRNKRIVGGTNASQPYADYIALDSNSNTTSTAWNVYGPRWDFGLPFSKKVLHGFHVTYESLPANSTITLYYKLDGATSWTQVSTTITTDSSTYAYVPVTTTSSTVSFRNMRVRIQGDYGATVYSVTAQAQLVEYSESWKLRLRLKDEPMQGGPRKRTTQARAETLRDNLRTLVTNKAAVTFLDGYRYKNPGVYSTHDVIVEFPTDGIGRNGEGIAEVVLRSIANA